MSYLRLNVHEADRPAFGISSPQELQPWSVWRMENGGLLGSISGRPGTGRLWELSHKMLK